MRADDLLAAVFPQALACQENIVGDIAIPDHPLVRETMKDVLTEALDIDGLKRVLADIVEGRYQVPRGGHSGALGLFARNPQRQSLRLSRRRAARRAPRARRGDAPRRCRSRWPPNSAGSIPPPSIEVRRDAWPDVRDADELHDALLTSSLCPHNATLLRMPGSSAPAVRESRNRSAVAAAFRRTDRAASRDARAMRDGHTYWVCAERARRSSGRFLAQLHLPTHCPRLASAASSQDDAVLAMITGWMSHAGPTTRERIGRSPRPSAARKSTKRCCASKPAAPSSAANSRASARSETRMVRAPSARAHSPATVGELRKADAAGHARAIHALALALAARRARHATHRRTRRPGNPPPAPGL